MPTILELVRDIVDINLEYKLYQMWLQLYRPDCESTNRTSVSEHDLTGGRLVFPCPPPPTRNEGSRPCRLDGSALHNNSLHDYVSFNTLFVKIQPCHSRYFWKKMCFYMKCWCKCLGDDRTFDPVLLYILNFCIIIINCNPQNRIALP